MHIPDSMMQGAVCPVTAVVSAAGLLTAVMFAAKSEKKPSASRFGAVAALIFAAQMMNFPISGGTSGHLLGGVLAAVLLGTPFGVLAVAAVVMVQSLVFADGGVTVLGANLLNMSIIGAGLGGMLYWQVAPKISRSINRHLTAAAIACISVVVASIAVSIELAFSGAAEFNTVISSMVTTHMLIGVGEGVITLVGCILFATQKQGKGSALTVAAPLALASIVALIFSSFASASPDGLEWVAEKFGFLKEGAPYFVSPLPDYSVPAISNEMLSTGLAGIVGVAITFAACFIFAKAAESYTSVSTAQ